LRAEKESLQKQLDQAKKDLEAAKAAPAPAATAMESTPSAPLADDERATLENKTKELETELAALNEVRPDCTFEILC
jgi:chromosome segregation ATPase